VVTPHGARQAGVFDPNCLIQLILRTCGLLIDSDLGRSIGNPAHRRMHFDL